MNNRFNFRTLPGVSSSTEANIFVHGYSAGHNVKDRQEMIDNVPLSIKHYTNIFAFWPSSHFSRFNGTSRKLLSSSTRIHLAAGAAALAADRAAHFLRIRSRADEMGEKLADQLDEYLGMHHPEINTINLIGHSLGGRLIVRSLKTLCNDPKPRLLINDVLLMAAAVEVEPCVARQMRGQINGRLINAYSKADRTLLMNFGEACLGRNPVECFENICIADFRHADYWKRLPEVLINTQYKSPLKIKRKKEKELPATADTYQDDRVGFALNAPSEVYQRINDELTRIVDSLRAESKDTTLDQAKDQAREMLSKHQDELIGQLESLEKNAEWDAFTIAFYGETGAGKSTIIETLRILLQEPSKLANQKAFREMQRMHDLSEEKFQILLNSIQQASTRLGDLGQKLREKQLKHEQLQRKMLSSITQLKELIAQRKEGESFWGRLLSLLLRLFRKTQDEIALARVNRELHEIVEGYDSASAPLLGLQAEAAQRARALEGQLQESEEKLEELHKLADGEIIGDGRADFTRQTQRYNFEVDGQSFALLDVPGIEGNKGWISSEIEKDVQTAHEVFYVTNQPAPPQTGDEQRKGTLEKIKAHLGAQTEVWAIFNKKITSPKHSLTDRPLISEDESLSLAGLDEIMREHLGEHYREVFSLTALPAFLAATDNFSPRSQNAKRRNKILADFRPEEILEKSRLLEFLDLLRNRLLGDSGAKITRANFHKAREALDTTVGVVGDIQTDIAELSEKLGLDGKSAYVQLSGSFSALEKRLKLSGETLIDKFESSVRDEMYRCIDTGIGNDYFKDRLKDSIKKHQREINEQLPVLMRKDVEQFQKDAANILKRFEEQTRELADIYAKLNQSKLGADISLNLNIDNGIQVGSILLSLVGGVLAFIGTGGWVLALGLVGVAFSAVKALAGFFSVEYKKAQQRASVSDNLRTVVRKLRGSLDESLKTNLPDMKKKIALLEREIMLPSRQAGAVVKLLDQSANQMKAISKNIDGMGTR